MAPAPLSAVLLGLNKSKPSYYKTYSSKIVQRTSASYNTIFVRCSKYSLLHLSNSIKKHSKKIPDFSFFSGTFCPLFFTTDLLRHIFTICMCVFIGNNALSRHYLTWNKLSKHHQHHQDNNTTCIISNSINLRDWFHQWNGNLIPIRESPIGIVGDTIPTMLKLAPL